MTLKGIKIKIKTGIVFVRQEVDFSIKSKKFKPLSLPLTPEPPLSFQVLAISITCVTASQLHVLLKGVNFVNPNKAFLSTFENRAVTSVSKHSEGHSCVHSCVSPLKKNLRIVYTGWTFKKINDTITTLPWHLTMEGPIWNLFCRQCQA